jgi:3-dehydroquinate synthase class II
VWIASVAAGLGVGDRAAVDRGCGLANVDDGLIRGRRAALMFDILADGRW